MHLAAAGWQTTDLVLEHHFKLAVKFISYSIDASSFERIALEQAAD